MMTPTSPFRICTLFSGSRGNAVYLRAGEIRILIDAGMSCRAITRALEAVSDTPDGLSAIFVTHEHSDHTKALPVFLKKYPLPTHMPEKCARALCASGMSSDCFCAHTGPFSVMIHKEGGEDTVTVTAFSTPHDAAASVGYRIVLQSGPYTRTVALATDMGHVTEEIRQGLLGADDVIIEANHDENMLLMGPYPYELKRRILSDCGHLSNEACGALLCDLVAGGTRRILLAHLSPENNTPELAYLTVLEALRRGGYQKDRDFSLAVAERELPVILPDAPVFTDRDPAYPPPPYIDTSDGSIRPTVK